MTQTKIFSILGKAYAFSVEIKGKLVKIKLPNAGVTDWSASISM